MNPQVTGFCAENFPVYAPYDVHTKEHMVSSEDDFRTYPWDAGGGGYRIRELEDDYVVWLVQKAFTWALVVGPDKKPSFDKHWCYTGPEEAIRSARAWDGNHPVTEPVGWFRDPYTGRRRPGGDPAREYINP